MALVFDDIKDEFIALVNNDRIAAKYAAAAAQGRYHEASLYAARVGDLLGRTLRRHAPLLSIEEWDLEKLIPQSLGLDHAMVVEVCVQTQTAINEANHLGIRAAVPEFDGNRAYGLVEELRENPEFTNIETLFYDQITNFSQNIVDRSVRDNAELQSNAGIDAYIVRTAEYGACEWCQNLEGTYNYEDVKNTGNDVWRRHDNCRCTIEYYNGRGGKNLVSSQYYNYRGQSGSSSMRYQRQRNNDPQYNAFMTQQINNIRESRGWTYEQALAYYHKHEDFSREVYGG